MNTYLILLSDHAGEVGIDTIQVASLFKARIATNKRYGNRPMIKRAVVADEPDVIARMQTALARVNAHRN